MKKIFKDNKVLILSFIIFLVLGILLGLLKVKNIPFTCFSIAANIFLITLIKMIITKFKIKFSQKEKITLILAILLLFIFYFISVLGRKFIYYWDFSCYYNIQIESVQRFNESLMSGLRFFIGSTWSGEYGSFLTFFPEVVFNLSSKTINAYVLSCVLVFIPYLVITFGILIKRLQKKFKIKKAELFFILSTCSFILFPIVHATFIYGQPDLFGLAFIFLIIALTIDYDFSKVDYERLFEIAIITFMLLITRRWYMYFILVYFICYGLYILLINIKNKNKIKLIIKHAMIYILVVGVFFLVTLYPLFKNIIVNGYSYDFYLSGGFSGELTSQIAHLGYLFLIMIIIGIINGIITKQYRKYSILLLLEYLLIILLFTRIQNMGLHHSLLLVYIYLYFIYMFIILILDKKIVIIMTIILSITNFMFGIYNNDSKIFTNVPLKTPEQSDYKEMLKVGKWLKTNLKNNNAYMITHNNDYNPDKFRSLYLPDTTIKDHLPYGSAVIGVHSFPISLFEAKYVITTEPFVNISIEDKYNKVFTELVKENKFKQIKEFDMKNGYTILIYERIEKVDKQEAEKYLNELEDISKDYPKLYKDVIENYIKSNFSE